MPSLNAIAGLLPPLEISIQESSMLVDLTETLTQHNIAQCSTVIVTRDGHADSRAWKELRRRDNIRVYKERARSRATPTTPSLLLLGTVKGNLDDVMYAMVTPTEQAMKIKSNCTHDGVIDRKVLHEIVRPSVDDPFRHVSVNWSLYADSEPHDYVCVEATGVTHTLRGERVGFHLSHSVAFSQLPSFSESHGVERGHRSICSLYRETTAGEVECYVRGFFDFRDGDNELLTNIALHAIANQWLSFSRQIEFAHMKKLVWRLRRNSSDLDDFVMAAAVEEHKRKMSEAALNREATCRSCEQAVCPRCRVKKRVCVLAPDQRTVLEKRRSFCAPCIAEVTTSNARAIAQEELQVQEEDQMKEAEEQVVSLSRQRTTSWMATSASFRSCI
ncbi:hypothetical protein PHYSODRAFT_506768 [Phytophthora sojae]|uniref:FYVE-type domain-containing protein n=1 Tax=Phytophthora sojae (strain P6497) TaxID=1094619 RepID=G4ZNP0_PHYSP|nr:hypothetical protein PHYSODRAFT_504844 [Phytophthora sojae]XP_009528518.1 hypothetical protein PHYSODRAFT_506768 [Phytophthora sojae]EGZ14721.1 hypothetical protein PHYSODRAFT_504844 [Phytophthora sojae]EGZ14769.1 hypothetical protein PHYSODRAFT_506768 [Phytophthora sojae]|eukprot:XP_009528470.1 hypothetical protein PHYSODRAFT_504844 [Phytophthora sojae]